VSDTPRTDELAKREFVTDGLWIKHARELERELAVERARLDWLSTESGSKWAHHESEQCNITRRAIDAAMKEVKP